LQGSTETLEIAQRLGITEQDYIQSRLKISDERSLSSYFVFQCPPPRPQSQAQLESPKQQPAFLHLDVSSLPVGISIELSNEARAIKSHKNQRPQVGSAFGPHSTSSQQVHTQMAMAQTI
jgi:hypothetical protein